MKLNSPLFVLLRILCYGLLLFGIAEGIFFDAAHPMEEGYFGEITFTEIGQKLFCLCCLLPICLLVQSGKRFG